MAEAVNRAHQRRRTASPARGEMLTKLAAAMLAHAHRIGVILAQLVRNREIGY